MENVSPPGPEPIIVELAESRPIRTPDGGESPLVTAFNTVEAVTPYIDDALKLGIGAAATSLALYGVWRGADFAQGRLNPTSALGQRYGRRRIERLEKKKAKHAPAAADHGNNVTGPDAATILSNQRQRAEDKARAGLITQNAGWKDLEYTYAVDVPGIGSTAGTVARDARGRPRIVTVRKRPPGVTTGPRPNRWEQTRVEQSGSRGHERRRHRDSNGNPTDGLPRDNFRGGLLGKIPGIGEPLRRNANSRRARAVHRERDRAMSNTRSGRRKRDIAGRVARTAGIRKDEARIGFSSRRSDRIDAKIADTRARHGL